MHKEDTSRPFKSAYLPTECVSIYIRFDAFKKQLPCSIVIGDGLRELPGVRDGHTVCAEVVVGGQGGARIGAISTGERHAAHRRGGRGRGGRVAQHGKLDEQKMI